MHWVVIMAGGSGTRFWPASRHQRPKQFLKIGSDRSLLRCTAERVAPTVEWSRIIVVTGAAHAEHARQDLPELEPWQVMVEPVGRNTAACIGWATHAIAARDPAARIAVLPADHYIGNEEGFRAHLQAAFTAAEDRIVLFGIVPSRPETGYGYIQRGDLATKGGGQSFHEVARFVEKPDLATAEGYLASGDYLWNGGIFVFAAQTMLDEIEAHLPELAPALKELAAAPDKVETIYPALQSISIDYGVMEQSERTWVMPSEFAWSDVGSWASVRDVYDKDDDNNVILGDALILDGRGGYVESRHGRFVAVIGLDDVVVVDSENAVLVAPKERAQDVKRVVEQLKKADRKDLL